MRHVRAQNGRPASGERIAKAIARAGLCSRREAEAWIATGRVAVNGEVVRGGEDILVLGSRKDGPPGQLTLPSATAARIEGAATPVIAVCKPLVFG